MSVAEVYEFVAAAGNRLTLPGHWKGLPCDSSFFHLAGDPGALLKALQKEFEAADLIESGVVQVDQEGISFLNSRLSTGNAIVWALRQRPETPPFDLVADLKSINPKNWSFVSPFFVHRIQSLIDEADNRILVAFSMSDLAIFSSLNLPAVPADGLAQMPSDRLEMFSKVLYRDGETDGMTLPGSLAGTPETAKEPRSLIFFDRSLELLGQGVLSEVEQTWKYMGDVLEFLGLPLDDFQIVKPTDKELARLRFIIEHGRWKDVRTALLDGPFEKAPTLLRDRSPRRPLPDSVSQGLKAWRRTQNQSSDAASRKAAWNEVLALLDRQIFDPLTAQAKGLTDPTERNLVMTVAIMSRLLHPQLLMMGERVGRAIGDRGANAMGTISKDEFNQVMAVADRVTALTNGVLTCRQSQPFRRMRSRPRPMKRT